MLDLADYDLKLIHVPGSKLCTPDTLSWRPGLIPKINNDNEGVTLLHPSLFVNLINIDLNKKITKSSEKDPLVLNALQALEGEVLTQFRSHLSDWSYNAGILTYQGRVFLPDRDNIRQDIVKLHHDHPTAGHPGYLKTCQLVSAGYWWPSDVPRMQQRSVEMEIQVYILCGSEGCNSRAVKWSPDVVSRSAKWCETKVRYSAIRWSVSRVRNRAKVQDGARQNDKMRQT